MAKKMLIDATHTEETRVAVIEGDRLEEFEYESELRKALKGSIFLAKVTRVEPSLQAAFVNFGGNRHGFLPFSEIHPDYFRIPIADREALMAEQEALLEEMQKAEEEEIEKEKAEEEGKEAPQDEDAESEEASEEATEVEPEADDEADDDVNGNKAEDEIDEADDVDGNKASGEESDDDENSGNRRGGRGRGRGRNQRGRGGRGRQNRSRRGERYGNSPEDAERKFRFNLRRKYKIQEVIKRGQIMLVQVSKEERGNKGAAVGSYLSLPGRYCVLMPNSPRAGGVSRKIANYKDRNRMREIMKDLEVPKGMSVILRTAGLSRTKTEIKRDLDYLIKLWNNIRELTLESSAPALVYEEADLIKRAVRDIYTRDVDEIQVSGEDGFKNAKNFMKMMIPSHAKKVKEYKDKDTPLFNKYRVERQIAEIGETQVTLPSGGYLVINPTEALVSVDVNSGRATKERHIEETALKTNLEAAEEVARQLRLRDLGGLVVIDFIDMEDRRNNGKVERRMRDALSGDRARVQVGRISSFGLMELSRQRLNPSLNESQFEVCKHCEGTGRVRTSDATSIMVLRAIEDEGLKGRAAQVIVHVSGDVALYILNNKRSEISRLEERYEFEILIRVDDSVGASTFRVEVSKPSGKNTSDDDEGDEEQSRGRRRGRRGGRRRGGRRNDDQEGSDEKEDVAEESSEEEEKPKKRGRKPSKKAEEEKSEGDKPKDDKKKPAKKATSKKKDEEKAEEAEDDKPKKKAAAKTTKKTTKKAEKADDKDEKKTAKAKKPAAKKSSKSSISNDDKPAKSEHETVNEVKGEKKKGWWNLGSK